MERNRRRFVGKGIVGYARYMKFKHELNITQNDYVIKSRLDAITFYHDFGLEPTLKAFNISRSTLFNWRKSYMDSRKSVKSLAPRSTKPKHTRRMNTNPQILNFIKEIRKKYPRFSKHKIKPLLDAYCEQEGINTLSISTIGKVIKRNNLFFTHTLKAYHNPSHKRPKKKPRKRINSRFKTKIPGELIQIDTVVRFENSIKLYTLTAIDLASRFAFAYTYTSLSSRTALNFYQKLEKVCPYPIRSVKTDNGLEFQGAFEQYLDKIGVTHYFSYPRTPQSNAYIERFNRTIQEECLEGLIEHVHDIYSFNEKLIDYLIFYNTIRPHHSLNYVTPMSYLLSSNLNSNKSNMYATCTIVSRIDSL